MFSKAKALQLLVVLQILIYVSSDLENLYVSFEDEVIKGTARATCRFKLGYNDENVHDVDVSCRNVNKIMTVDYEHKTKTMHTIKLKMKIMKNGRTRIISTAIERGDNFKVEILDRYQI